MNYCILLTFFISINVFSQSLFKEYEITDGGGNPIGKQLLNYSEGWYTNSYTTNSKITAKTRYKKGDDGSNLGTIAFSIYKVELKDSVDFSDIKKIRFSMELFNETKLKTVMAFDTKITGIQPRSKAYVEAALKVEDFETKQKIFNAILNATDPIRIIISIKGIRLKETFTFTIAPQQ